MRLLLDSCVSARACAFLRDRGHDVLYAAELPADPGDAPLLARAHSEERILVTLDKDFGDLAVQHGAKHSGILRLVMVRAADQGLSCALVVESPVGVDLLKGAIVVCEPDRVRVRSNH